MLCFTSMQNRMKGVARLLWMQPRVWLAFRAASAHCRVMSSFSSTSTPI